MGKYRIISYDSAPKPVLLEEEWQALPPEYQRDLDFAEITEINNAYADGDSDAYPPAPRFRPEAVFVLMLLFAFLWFALGHHLVAALRAEPQDISFLADSAILAQDEALRTLRESVVRISGPRSSGSGFNLRPEGLIVTNRHVEEGNTPVTVRFPDGRRYNVRNWLYIEGYDLALAELGGADLPHVNISEDLPEVGSGLIFIGNPLGFDWTISQAELLSSEPDHLVLAGPVRPGSSGSPLFNQQGEVIGVIYARLLGVSDRGLAVPATVLLSYLLQ